MAQFQSLTPCSGNQGFDVGAAGTTSCRCWSVPVVEWTWTCNSFLLCRAFTSQLNSQQLWSKSLAFQEISNIFRESFQCFHLLWILTETLGPSLSRFGFCVMVLTQYWKLKTQFEKNSISGTHGRYSQMIQFFYCAFTTIIPEILNFCLSILPLKSDAIAYTKHKILWTEIMRQERCSVLPVSLPGFVGSITFVAINLSSNSSNPDVIIVYTSLENSGAWVTTFLLL